MAPSLADHWALDPSIDFLNHGSYGACPRVVLAAQRAWQDRMEAEPVQFLGRDLEGYLAEARTVLGDFIGADPEDLAFVSNATTGVNTVLGSVRFAPGDELLTSDHEYNAVLNAIRTAAARDGARVVVARIPFPIRDPGEVVEAVVGATTPRTRLAVFSHVTSPTALVFPVAELVRELDRQGVDTLLDGAHAPGMVPLDLTAIGAAYATGNAHKWICAPKGAAYLHVRRDRRERVRPLVISHGANDRRTDRTRFRAEFDWTGTADPTAPLTIPTAIDVVGGLRPDGWPGLMAANHALAIEAGAILWDALEIEPPAPADMLGAMAAVPLPPGLPEDLELRLVGDHRIEVPVTSWPVDAALDAGEAPRARLLRVSAQAYNHRGQYERLASVLRDMRGAAVQSASGRNASAE